MWGGGEGKTFSLSSNEKSRVISAAKVKQLWKQILYRYINQNNDDERCAWIAYKNMATESGVYSTICTMNNQYYTKQLTQKFKPAEFPPCST